METYSISPLPENLSMRRIKKLSVVAMLLFFPILCIFSYFLFAQDDGLGSVLFFILFGVSACVVMLFIFVYLFDKYKFQFKRQMQVLQEIVKKFDGEWKGSLEEPILVLPRQHTELKFSSYPGCEDQEPQTILQGTLNRSLNGKIFIAPESLIDKVGKHLGIMDIKVESSIFDNTFKIKCSGESIAHKVLTHEIQELFLRLAPYQPKLNIEEKSFYFSLSVFSSNKMILEEFIETAVKLIQDIQ